jgi:hypothetical protein
MRANRPTHAQKLPERSRRRAGLTASSNGGGGDDVVAEDLAPGGEGLVGGDDPLLLPSRSSAVRAPACSLS